MPSAHLLPIQQECPYIRLFSHFRGNTEAFQSQPGDQVLPVSQVKNERHLSVYWSLFPCILWVCFAILEWFGKYIKPMCSIILRFAIVLDIKIDFTCSDLTWMSDSVPHAEVLFQCNAVIQDLGEPFSDPWQKQLYATWNAGRTFRNKFYYFLFQQRIRLVLVKPSWIPWRWNKWTQIKLPLISTG